MEEREVGAVESQLRRALSSLDELRVPTLGEVRAPRRVPVWRALLAPAGAVAVIAAALVVGAGLAAWRDALATHGAASGPTAVDASALPASRYLDVAGYRFRVSLVADPAFRSSGADSDAHVSAIDGIGVRCIWDRLGPDLTGVSVRIGPPAKVSSPAGYDVVTSGAHVDQLIGVPLGSIQGRVATIVCGASDLYGDHGVVATLALSEDPRIPIRSLTLAQWTGSR